MPSSNAVMETGNKKLSKGSSSAEVPEDFKISKKSRRRQRKNAAKAQAASSNLADTGPSPPNHDVIPVDNKPKNWKASLTIAELKALKTEEATKKHNQQFPPRAKRDTDLHTVTKPKKTQQVLPAAEPAQKPKAAPAEKPNKAAPAEKPNKAAPTTEKSKPTLAGKPKRTPVEEPKPVLATTCSDFDQSGILYEMPRAPCGIRGCPVRANHQRRPYLFNEDHRPAMIKMIQSKGDAATRADWNTVDRFFKLHENAGKPANVKPQA